MDGASARCRPGRRAARRPRRPSRRIRARRPTPTPAPTPGSEVPGDNPHSVSVRSTEFRFSLSQPSVEPGEVKVQFDNSRAEDPHALAYRGPSADEFDTVAAGAVVRYTLTLSAGSYTLFCPLPEHEGLGMKATLTVR